MPLLRIKGNGMIKFLFKSRFDGGNLWIQQNKMVFHLQDYSGTQEAHANFDDKRTKKNQ